MACAKQAAEAEQLGGKLLQLCRKKAPEKELLRVLEVRPKIAFQNHPLLFFMPHAFFFDQNHLFAFRF